MAYMFVDGRYLTERLRTWSDRLTDGDEIELDYNQFLRGAEKTFYYDALPTQRDKELPDAFNARLKKAEALHSTISAVNGCHVFNGKTVEGGKRIRQKGVDVMLAVHALTHVFRKNDKAIILLAGDADFVPLARALVMEGAYVEVRYARTSFSPDLVEAADSTHVISPVEVLQRTTPEFRKKHPQPTKGVSGSPSIGPACNIIRKGTSPHGDAILYQDSAHLILMAPTENQQYVRLSWHDVDHLVALAKEDGLDIKWA